MRRWDEAFVDADRLLRERPDSATARHLRAQAGHFRGRHALAVEDLTVLLSRNPDNWPALELRAACYAALGKNDKARADWTAADALLSDVSPVDLNDTAWRLVTEPAKLRDTARALQLIHHALSAEPNNKDFWITRGVALYRNGEYKQALAALEKSAVGKKNGPEALELFVMAICQAKLGQATKAQECFHRAVQRLTPPTDPLPAHVEDLKVFRAEAEQALRLP